MINFVVPGAPQGKGRPRVGKAGGFVRIYTPAKTVSYEGLIAYHAHNAMGGLALLDRAVSVKLVIRVPIPRSWSQRKQREAALGLVLPTTKPDVDNVEKAVFDALNGVVWRDDVVVCDVVKCKRYSFEPGLSITVEPLVGAESSHTQSPLPRPEPAEAF